MGIGEQFEFWKTGRIESESQVLKVIIKNKCCADCSCEEPMQPCENKNALYKN